MYSGKVPRPQPAEKGPDGICFGSRQALAETQCRYVPQTRLTVLQQTERHHSWGFSSDVNSTENPEP